MDEKTNNYKVFIPCAGIGSRMGKYTTQMNKTLLTVGYKPVISHLIERIQKDVEIVIALGYRGNHIRDFLTVAYPNRKITFVDVENYEGKGSGLGHTILCCKDHLQCPFIFASNDTYIVDDLELSTENYVGYSETIVGGNQYRSISITGNKLYTLNEKGEYSDNPAYIGVAGIVDYVKFWEYMTSGGEDAVKLGESYAILKMCESRDFNIQVKKFNWSDCGDQNSFRKLQRLQRHDDGIHILEKEDEAIWFIDGSVVKFSVNSEFIKQRVERSMIVERMFPEITRHSEHAYAYDKIKGKTFSTVKNRFHFSNLLYSLKHFWTPVNLSKPEYKHFRDVCLEFYKTKTEERVKLYHSKFLDFDTSHSISGDHVGSIRGLLNQIDWNTLTSHCRPCNFHGDLHFENILIGDDDKHYTLIDWRQNFGGILEYGDVYYDLAKLYHGIIVSHEMVFKNLYNFSADGYMIDINIQTDYIRTQYKHDFFKFLEDNQYNIKTVEILTALIFLNIAALHHDPYSRFLFYLGKRMLHDILNNDN